MNKITQKLIELNIYHKDEEIEKPTSIVIKSKKKKFKKKKKVNAEKSVREESYKPNSITDMHKDDILSKYKSCDVSNIVSFSSIKNNIKKLKFSPNKKVKEKKVIKKDLSQLLFELFSSLTNTGPLITFNLYCYFRHSHLLDDDYCIFDLIKIIRRYNFSFDEEIIVFDDFKKIIDDFSNLSNNSNNKDKVIQMLLNDISKPKSDNTIYQLFLENSLNLLWSLSPYITTVIKEVLIFEKSSEKNLLMKISFILLNRSIISYSISDKEINEIMNIIPNDEKCVLGSLEWIIEYIILVCMKSYKKNNILDTIRSMVKYFKI